MEEPLITSIDSNYKAWLIDLKTKFRQTQIRAAVKVSHELLGFYWDLGSEIVDRQRKTSWGSGFLKQLSQDLMLEFTDIKGFSKRNLERIRKWYLFYNEEVTNRDTSCVAIDKLDFKNQIFSIPWSHNIAIVSKCSDLQEALFYTQQTIQHGWSRSVLTHQIESQLYQRNGSAISNFSNTLPPIQSDLAQQTLKDPYLFDFLMLTEDYNERDLENQLTEHISKFLIELGAGFAYVGKQVAVSVSDRDFFLDLLFYHTKLHCYVVIELKTGQFEPEHAGKLNFYLKAVDETIRTEQDNPTIGILICKNRDSLIAEYALSDINKPIGVSKYQLTQSLPDTLKSSLPSIEDLEEELNQAQS